MYIKMSKNLSAKHYQENKERLKKKKSSGKILKNISNKEKEKKQQYGRKHYKNLSEDEKQKLFEYGKKYYRMRKMSNYNCKKHLF